MTTTGVGATTTLAGPERPGGQGLDPHQEESGNLAIYRLLTTSEGESCTDFVATYRREADGTGAYEAWARRGMVGWVRTLADAGGYEYRVVEVLGQNPLERQDHTALATIEAELAAGRDPSNPLGSPIKPAALTYPFAYERISQLFDSPDAPDLVVNPRSYAFGLQPGQHGALDVVQSRSPLIFSGPGVKAGAVVEAAVRQVDIAPTIARLMDFPLVDGADETGRTSAERGVEPDVYFRRQDGRPIEAVLDGSGSRPQRVYILLLDGQSHTELFHRLEADGSAIPHLRRLIERGLALRYGSIANFPSITWPTHNAIGTSTWCGHHGIVNPTYYLRPTRQTVSPQGQQFDTARFLAPEVETLYEAFHRVYGPWAGQAGAFTACLNEPCTRGADHASLERRLVGDREQLKALTRETEGDISPRWANELEPTQHHLIGLVDNRALAQARQLFEDPSHPPPMLTWFEFSLPDGAAHDYGPHHEGARQALDETDVRVGRILSQLDGLGLFDSTLFVITTDHGMAVQDVALAGNPARIPEREGMAAITTEPFVYLRDLQLEIALAPDGRTARVQVLDNDADTMVEHPPVPGCELLVSDHRDGKLAAVTTGPDGAAGFAIPPDLRPSAIRLAARAPGFNPRHVLLDGANLLIDLRSALYGASA